MVMVTKADEQDCLALVRPSPRLLSGLLLCHLANIGNTAPSVVANVQQIMQQIFRTNERWKSGLASF